MGIVATPGEMPLITAERRLAMVKRQSTLERRKLALLRQKIALAERRLNLSANAQLVEANEQLVLATIRAQIDVNNANQALDVVTKSAELDPLTSLPNRAILLDRLNHAIAGAKRHKNSLAVLFLDLDNFKQINDRMGHAVGDEVLKRTATSLSSSVRQFDTVSRIGGDEFLILVVDIAGAMDAVKVAKKIYSALATPNSLGDADLTLRASIGISLFPGDGEDAATLIHRADGAMYRAKRAGLGSFAFHGQSPAGSTNFTSPTSLRAIQRDAAAPSLAERVLVILRHPGGPRSTKAVSDTGHRSKGGAIDAPLRQVILMLDIERPSLAVVARVLETLGFGKSTEVRSLHSALTVLGLRTSETGVVTCNVNLISAERIAFVDSVKANFVDSDVILLSGEGDRLLKAVQKLLLNRWSDVERLERPASRSSLRDVLLKCYRQRLPDTTQSAAQILSVGEIDVANQEKQWVLHYQPKVDVRSRKLIGVEALVRCRHPSYGLVYPNGFIDIAEECGAIGALTDWVLEHAMSQLVRWQSEDLPVHMSINLSMDSLRAPEFARNVADIARTCQANPADVILEITESRLMDPSSVPFDGLVKLRLQGFGLSIDDFGAGHSSLSLLRDIPFTELKIDRGFVHDATDNHVIRAILEGSVGIAARLGIPSVAEGVETLESWNLLRDLECDMAQGFFIGYPMEAEKIPQWIAQWNKKEF